MKALNQFQLQPPLHNTTHKYTKLHNTTQLQLHSINIINLHYKIQLQLDYISLHFSTLNYTTPHYGTQHYATQTRPTATSMLFHTTLHQTTRHYTKHHTTLRSLHHQKFNCNYTKLITLHHNHNHNSTTLQLQLQLHYATLHPAVVGEVTDQVTSATIATIPTHHDSNHFWVHQ